MLDLSSNIGFLPVVGFHAEPLPGSKTFVVSRAISNVVAVN
jgi:hypothetical protein